MTKCYVCKIEKVAGSQRFRTDLLDDPSRHHWVLEGVHDEDRRELCPLCVKAIKKILGDGVGHCTWRCKVPGVSIQIGRYEPVVLKIADILKHKTNFAEIDQFMDGDWKP